MERAEDQGASSGEVSFFAFDGPDAVAQCVLLGDLVSSVGAKLGLDKDRAALRLKAAQTELVDSPASDAALRFRLWARLSEALALPSTPPLSRKSCTRSASAFAVRASERLTPSIRARHRKNEHKVHEGGIANKFGRKAAEYWKAAKATAVVEPPLPFPDIVAEEMLALLADEEIVEAAAREADPEIAKALRAGQVRARNAIAAGGVWAGGAAVVANAGFLPYVLAAQLSAVIPLVSGPVLVSFLATLINPLTVFAGVAALGWLGMGKGSKIVRSQVAARLGVLMAAQGARHGEAGLDRFLAEMRSLDERASESFSWMRSGDRTSMRRRDGRGNALACSGD